MRGSEVLPTLPLARRGKQNGAMFFALRTKKKASAVALALLVGAIGVGGARGSEKDEACAIAGLKEIEGQFD